MDDPLPPPSCPFIQKLVRLLFETSGPTGPVNGQLLFESLISLEMDAEIRRAPETSVRVISTVREITGRALAPSVVPRIRGH